MNVRLLKPAIWMVLIAIMAGMLVFTPAKFTVYAQQPTGSIPTVTSTLPRGQVTVYQDLVQIKVYAGPSQYEYPAIGVLLAGETAPAIAWAKGGEWIQIAYPGVPGSTGWVYARWVSLVGGQNLPIVDPPSTPTPASTPTINPTLAAAFVTPQTPTRLPTFTEPAPLVMPTYEQDSSVRRGIPMGLVILTLGILGVFGAFIAFSRFR
jgi:uncharacterized protein YraI